MRGTVERERLTGPEAELGELRGPADVVQRRTRRGGGGGDLRVVGEQLVQAVHRADAAADAFEDGRSHRLRHPAAVEGDADDQPVRRSGSAASASSSVAKQGIARARPSTTSPASRPAWRSSTTPRRRKRDGPRSSPCAVLALLSARMPP